MMQKVDGMMKQKLIDIWMETLLDLRSKYDPLV